MKIDFNNLKVGDIIYECNFFDEFQVAKYKVTSLDYSDVFSERFAVLEQVELVYGNIKYANYVTHVFENDIYGHFTELNLKEMLKYLMFEFVGITKTYKEKLKNEFGKSYPELFIF